MHPDTEFQLHLQRAAREEQARRHRHPVQRARPPGRLRRAAGRHLIRLGERLAGSVEPRPARSPAVHATRGR